MLFQYSMHSTDRSEYSPTIHLFYWQCWSLILIWIYTKNNHVSQIESNMLFKVSLKHILKVFSDA